MHAKKARIDTTVICTTFDGSHVGQSAMVFAFGASWVYNIERAMVLLQTRISRILRKRGEEEQTANADGYSLDDRMRVCRLGAQSYIIWGGHKTGNREYQVKQARLRELLGSVRN